MSSVNKVILIGNLGKDPETRSFQNGGKVCNFSIATTEKWTDKASGEKKERADWHNIVIKSDGLAGVAERFLKKGSKVYVEGQLQTRKWQDQAGNDRYSTEVVLSGPGASLVMLDGAGERTGGGAKAEPAASGGWGSDAPANNLDDEIPW